MPDLDAIRRRLQDERAALLDTATTNEQAAATVELDQTKVGRVSRMDAMQAQAMSLEAKRRQEIQLLRIESALQRLAQDDYGECLRCGEAIDPARLDFDPTVLWCIDCAEEAER